MMNIPTCRFKYSTLSDHKSTRVLIAKSVSAGLALLSEAFHCVFFFNPVSMLSWYITARDTFISFCHLSSPSDFQIW